jgi:tRNA uridine 5-carbamoylmethylation protein Kti12
MQKKIDDVAIMWNKTRDPKYKDLWYKLIKEYANGPHNTERWNVSVSSVNKADDGTYVISGKRIRSI